jgi:hypothetical protein
MRNISKKQVLPKFGLIYLSKRKNKSNIYRVVRQWRIVRKPPKLAGNLSGQFVLLKIYQKPAKNLLETSAEVSGQSDIDGQHGPLHTVHRWVGMRKCWRQVWDGYEKMLMSTDKVIGWCQKGQKHAEVILEWSLRPSRTRTGIQNICILR